MSLKIYLFSLSNMVSKSSFFSDSLSAEDQKQFDKISNKNRALEFSASRFLLRKILRENYGCPHDFQINTSKRGKPFINSDIYFNITHTENIIGLVISKEFEVGIDIESQNRVKSYNNVAKKYFSKNEIDFIEAEVDQEKKTKRFLQLWTLKEAFFKTVEVDFNDENIKMHFNLEDLKIEKSPVDCRVKVFTAKFDNYFISVGAKTQNEIQTSIKEVHLVENQLEYKLREDIHLNELSNRAGD